LTQHVSRQTLLPVAGHAITGEPAEPVAQQARGADPDQQIRKPTPVDYEPDPEKILRRLVPDYIETSIYRALVESAAGFFGAQMTAMRSASENAGEIIEEYTLQMNRARQAEITQEIMEVVAGAEGLS
ncbi:MAG: F0F1 ATP synthase subunit gamma, partial [Actinomycetota bacterium]|nr:F0F1 ATP synthase subunit gamma [Actinomycetota bacterium]